MVQIESVEEWSPEDLPLFPFLGQYNKENCLSFQAANTIRVFKETYLFLLIFFLPPKAYLMLLLL